MAKKKTLFFLIFFLSLPSFARPISIFDAEVVLNSELTFQEEKLFDLLNSSDSSNNFNFALINQAEAYSNFLLEFPSQDLLFSGDAPINFEFVFVNQAEVFSHFNLENPYRPLLIIEFSPNNPTKGTEIKFDASKSYSLHGQLIKFDWQIKKESQTLAKLSGPTISFIFPENGNYEITLIVTDTYGATSSTSTIIKVKPFSFALITDIHIGRGYEDYQGEDYYLPQRLKNVVKWINEHRDNVQCGNATCSIKFLAISGDITNNTSLSGFCKAKEILDKLEIPYVPVFGNHDVGPDEEYERERKWKGQDYFDQVFWSTSSIPCQKATSTKNFETLLREFNFQRDEQNKDYKNFSFTFGGINFIGLDFVSREKFAKIGPGVGSDAVLNEINKNWLKEKLEEFKGKPVILLTHHPLIDGIPLGTIYAFSPFEISEIEDILNDKLAFLNLAGHIHSFEEIHGKLAPQNANKKYSFTFPSQVLTTEALMVGSNGRGVEKETEENGVRNGKKGTIRIVKIFDIQNINPNNWETTETGDEFLALNPQIVDVDYETKCFSDKACMEFESSFFTEKKFLGCWEIEGKNIGCGEEISYKDEELDCQGSIKELKCKFSEFSKIYNLKLNAFGEKITESISRKIEVKAGIFSKLIKVGKELTSKVEMISLSTGRNLLKKGRSFKDKVMALIKHSKAIPVGIFEVDFGKAKEDIDFSYLIIDSNLEKRKSILYMEKWPEEVEKLKVLYLPIK